MESVPDTGANQVGLWTWGQGFPQDGDSPDNYHWTWLPGDSRRRTPCSIRHNSGKGRLFPLSTDQLLPTSFYKI